MSATPPGLPAWMLGPETTEMTVAAKRAVCEGVVELDLRVRGDGAIPSWQPGAHVDLHLPGGLVRQYSLCGDPADRSGLRVAVLREPESRGGSRHLHDVAAVGDVISVGGPRNHFQLVPSPAYLFVAGGIGIAPLLPMIAGVRSSGADWTLLYGGRSRRTMAFLEQLEADPRASIVPEDERGRPDLAAALDAAAPETAIYCCGPESLLVAMEEICAERGHTSLHLERFKPRTDLPEEAARPFEVVLARSRKRMTVARDSSILETLAAAGVPVPSSCLEGTCGACETTVLEGRPAHRDAVLSPAEQAASDCMMICVSRSHSETLVLDI